MTKEERNKIVEENMALVKSICGKYKALNSSLDYDDLVQIGALGLIAAVDKFDKTRGNKFSTFAYPYIKGYINSSIAKDTLISLPKEYRYKINLINYYYNKLCSELGFEPSDEDIAKEMNISIEEYNKLNKAKTDINWTSLQATVKGGKDQNSLLIDFIEDESINPEKAVNGIVISSRLSELTQKQRRAIELKYYENFSTQEIADRLKITRQAVNQIINKGLKRMKIYSLS